MGRLSRPYVQCTPPNGPIYSISSEALPRLELGFVPTVDQGQPEHRGPLRIRGSCYFSPSGGISIFSNARKGSAVPQEQLELQRMETEASSPSCHSTQQSTGPSPGSASRPQVPQRTGKRLPAVAVAPVLHPPMTFAPVDQHPEQQDPERITGGCCICPSGGIWVCGCGATVDDEMEQAQQVLQRQEAETSRSQVPPRPHPHPQSSTAGSLREPGHPMPTYPPQAHPEHSREPSRRAPAQSLPALVRPQPSQLPRQTAGGRAQSLRTRPPPNV